MGNSKFLFIATCIAVTIYVISATIARGPTDCHKDCNQGFTTLKQACEMAYSDDAERYKACMKRATEYQNYCSSKCGN